MSRCQSAVDPSRSLLRPYLGLAVLAATLSAGGCSADIARFDFPSAKLAEGSTGSNPVPSEGVHSRSNLGADNAVADSAANAPSSYDPPVSNRSGAVEMSALPDTPQPSAPPTNFIQTPRAPERVANFASSTTAAATASGEQIEVRPGDTLYGLSKRHKVSLNELMTTNGLTTPALKPGQKLVLPSGKPSLRPMEAPRTETAALPAVEAPADWSGTYTVRPGDSLYAIARQNKIKLTDLQRYNGISDVRRVKPGATLKVPGSSLAASSEPVASVLAPAATTVATAPVTAPHGITVTPPETQNSSQPTILNSQRPSDPAAEQKVAELKTDTATDATAAPVSIDAGDKNTGKLRWPARGKMIANYGPRPDGTHNDGINLAVPMGTDVHAAEGGTVAYAGSELKGYGNLILLRHDNGWVTAYAHADELLVKRGDKVKRGQVIAKAGKTGQVDQPQVHFEVRQSQKPVDPSPLLERL